MNSLFVGLEKHAQLSEECIYELTKHATVSTIKSRTKLLEPSQRQDELVYIIEGITRNYFQDGDKELTTFFSQPGDFLLYLDDFLFGLRCNEHIESCTTLEVVKIPKAVFNKLSLIYPELNTLERRVANKYIEHTLIRMFNWRSLSASERYSKFVEENTYLSRRLQMQHIATYLDITPYSLSRIRRQYKPDL